MNNEIFKHKFFGWLEAEARRHINPDGSEGAIVAVTARIAEGLTLSSALIEIGPYAYIGSGAYIGPRAKIGSGANIGFGANIGSDAYIGPDANVGPRAKIEKGDWFMSIGPIGSEGRHTTIVHKCGVGLRFWTGCFQDKTGAEFRAAIAETHGDNQHAKAYLWMLDAVERHPEVLKREAGNARFHPRPKIRDLFAFSAKKSVVAHERRTQHE